VSHDSAERPILVWGDLGSRNVGCIAFPTETGWTQGEEIPGSDGIFLSPTVMVDTNRDVWVSIDPRETNGLKFTHTYVVATASTPRILSNRVLRGVSWMLSEPAPDSWWTVLRSRNGQPYEEAARIQAGLSRNMSWIDTSPAGGTLRYKVRRECLDVRYQWESTAGSWPPVSGTSVSAPETYLAIRVLDGSPPALELSGVASSPVELEFFDLQGRRVLSQRLAPNASESDTIRFDLGGLSQRLTPGIYFARAREESGRTSEPAKLVILR